MDGNHEQTDRREAVSDDDQLQRPDLRYLYEPGRSDGNPGSWSKIQGNYLVAGKPEFLRLSFQVFYSRINISVKVANSYRNNL